ncbi:hypothetical protein CC86DRAFT_11543 [Ophiobolus disseminans]|uniref:Uncharacterized protein n=1 Tax=Ophiobolus disseminans TaxID=1469910 RepID=A0A6A7AJY1_9PLEO|nr:hypothetical protein CC86DRAFT_11543 [Ophiobolus disseminans]
MPSHITRRSGCQSLTYSVLFSFFCTPCMSSQRLSLMLGNHLTKTMCCKSTATCEAQSSSAERCWQRIRNSRQPQTFWARRGTNPTPWLFILLHRCSPAHG